MSDTFAEKQKNRFQYLKGLYEVSDGNPEARFRMWDLGAELGFAQVETDNICNYLTGQGLLEERYGFINITHAGVVEVEEALGEPNKPTLHFPVSIIHNTGTIGAVQQNVQHSTQTVLFNEQQTQSVSEFIERLKAELPKSGLSQDAQAEAGTQVATVDLQLKSAKPNQIIIGESLKTVRNLLEGVTGNLVAADLLTHFHHFFSSLGIQ